MLIINEESSTFCCKDIVELQLALCDPGYIPNGHLSSSRALMLCLRPMDITSLCMRITNSHPVSILDSPATAAAAAIAATYVGFFITITFELFFEPLIRKSVT